jgi:hypothetical protein
MLRRTALSIAFLATWPAVAAADSNNGSIPDSWATDALSIVAFGILVIGLFLMMAPPRASTGQRLGHRS